MNSSYFSSFPLVKYYNNTAANITLRVAFIERLKELTSIYYPYIIKDGETADTIASWYYEDPAYDWLIYLANNIIDPYSQWPKDYNSFQAYIIKKYGSIEASKSNIEFYRKKSINTYVSMDGTDFSDIPIDNYNLSSNYTDIRITAATYSIIPDQSSYDPVYTYDYEIELNEDKRNIILIDNAYANKINREFKDLING